MRVVAFVAITGFFFALNALAALLVVGLGKFVPEVLREEPLAWIVVGALSLAGCIWCAMKSMAFIGRRSG